MDIDATGTKHIETNSQRKKRLAREFNDRRLTDAKEREQRIVERIAFEATPEGQHKLRVSRQNARQIITMAAGLSLVRGRGPK